MEEKRWLRNSRMFINLSFVLNCILATAYGETTQKSTKFFIIGDWGGLPFWPYRTLVQAAVSKRMAMLSDKLNMDFVVSLGDNFYLNGVKDVHDIRFKIPWLIISGNHDHYGNVTAQMEYSRVSKRWYYPYYYYKKSFSVPDSTAIIDIVLIDTTLLCGNADPEKPERQPVLAKAQWAAAEKQWKWLETTLKTSKAKYLLVCGHYPVYSIALHGNTDCLVHRLVPLLEKYHVTAYISGHDHNIQHIQPNGTSWKVNYFVCGTANFIDPSKKNIHKVPAHSLLFHWGNFLSLGAVGYIDARAENMTIRFYESSQELLYYYSMMPRI